MNIGLNKMSYSFIRTERGKLYLPTADGFGQIVGIKRKFSLTEMISS